MTCPWPLVSVHWIDAFDSTNGWVEVETYKCEPANVVTVGFLWPDCLKNYISITGSYMPDEVPNLKTVGMVTHIPVDMVQKIVIIEQQKIDLTSQHPYPKI